MIDLVRRWWFYLSTEKEFRTDVQKDMTKVEARLQNLEKHVDTMMTLIREQKALIESLYLAAHRHEEVNEDSGKETEGNKVESGQH